MKKLLIEKKALENSINELVCRFVIDNPEFDIDINIDVTQTYAHACVSKNRKLTRVNTKTYITLTV